MEEIIKQKLMDIERTENVRILLAVESGSRAWGFASPDSDYDVRFLYVRPKTDYLRLEAVRDVIELPINEVLDINGWDLQKALRLLYTSNPTMLEWLMSPIVYRDTALAERLRALKTAYFSPKKCLYHYLSTAKKNNATYLSKAEVKVKKYFYVLRPLLACLWILEKNTQPPMLFSELVEAELPSSLRADVDTLLELKMRSREIQTIPRVTAVQTYIDSLIADISAKLEAIPNQRNIGWDALDKFFLDALEN